MSALYVEQSQYTEMNSITFRGADDFKFLQESMKIVIFS